jgi:glycosyltransferase involved in cell wall biosynthesis
VKITFVLPHAGLSGGVRVVAIYADYLQRAGHTVTCISTPRRDISRWSKAKRLLSGNFKPHELRGPTHLDDVDVPHHVIERFRPVVDSDVPDADVVVATWWETAEWVAALSPAKGVKTHLIQHDETQIARNHVDRVHATWRLPLQRVVVARWLADVARDRYGVRDVVVVPNGVDTDLFHAPQRLKQRVPTVGTMFSLVSFKGCDVALEAVRLARQSIPELQLKCFSADLPTDKMPLPPYATLAHWPAQEKIRDIYAACDAWLFASRSEGFGLPILEAMACRTPVIGTPTGAAPEVIGAGGGLLVAPEDPIAMSRAIVKVMRMDDAEWLKLSDAAVATAGRFRWDSSARQFEAFLRQAVAGVTRAA